MAVYLDNFVCPSCNFDLLRNVRKLGDLASKNYCPQCGTKLNDSEVHFTYVVEGIIRTSGETDDLIDQLYYAVDEYDGDYMRSPRTNSRVRTTRLRTSILEYLTSGSVDNPTVGEFNILSELAISLITKLRDNNEYNSEYQQFKNDDTKDTTDLSSIEADTRQEGKESSEREQTLSPAEKEPQPIVEKRSLTHRTIGNITILVIGTQHNAPMLDKIYNTLEDFNPDIILLESGTGDEMLASTSYNAVGHRAAKKYKSMNSNVSVNLLYGTPSDTANVSGPSNGEILSESDGWYSTDPEKFREDSNITEERYPDYHRRVMENRNRKFSIQLFDHIEEYSATKVALICGKGHIPYFLDTV